MNPVEVSLVVIRDHKELVGGRELDVAPDIGKQLCQLRLHGGENNDLFSQQAKQITTPLEAVFRKSGNDLRQRFQFCEGLSFGDPFRAKSELDFFVVFSEP